VVQDMFMNETAREFGTVFLPAASSFEKEGTFMNAERRIQPVRKVLEPVGASMPDWQIVCELARAMGKGASFRYESAEQIWEEIRKLWKAGAGISYRRLEQGGLQWPCPSEDHPGTTRLHQDRFPIGPRAALRRVDYIPTVETVSDEYPFLLTTGRTLYQFNAGTMTQRTLNSQLRPADWLDVAPEDAALLAIGNGDRVRLRSRHGMAVLPVRVTTLVKRGELFSTFHFPEVFLNQVTGKVRDRTTATPEYKVTAVRIEKLDP